MAGIIGSVLVLTSHDSIDEEALYILYMIYIRPGAWDRDSNVFIKVSV